MSIEGQAQLRCSCSFRSATDYRSPINGLSEINRFELFYKHCIPTGFPDRLLKQGVNEIRLRVAARLPHRFTRLKLRWSESASRHDKAHRLLLSLRPGNICDAIR